MCKDQSESVKADISRQAIAFDVLNMITRIGGPIAWPSSPHRGQWWETPHIKLKSIRTL